MLAAILVLVLLAVLALCAAWAITSMPGRSHRGPLPALTGA